MKSLQINFFLILLVVAFAPNSLNAKDIQTGEWSESVNGIQGRLSAAQDSEVNGTKQIAVYLELRNGIHRLNPLEIYFNPHKSIISRVVDSKDKRLAPPPTNFGNIMTPFPFWIVMPDDSTIRFKISVSGYGVQPNGGTQIQMINDNSISSNWLIGVNDKKNYYLEGTFVSQAPKFEIEKQVWEGTIKLSKVLIPKN